MARSKRVDPDHWIALGVAWIVIGLTAPNAAQAAVGLDAMEPDESS